MAKNKFEIKSLYYITHIDNVTSILANGILSHRQIEKHSLPFTPIYDTQIISNRKEKQTPDGQTLWDFANLYFQPRNPMLYRVLHEKSDNDIAVVGVNQQVLRGNKVYVTTGNAASNASQFLPVAKDLNEIAKIWDIISSEWWNDVDGSKRIIMAECLVPNFVSPDLIHSIYVANQRVADKVRKIITSSSVSIVPEPNMFFRPAKRFKLSDLLSLVEGDMFFSTMQTLTVSVNTVGIMGKGLASRAKYQFPDVYVNYQEACRRKALRMGKPFLYKREGYLDQELADEPNTLQNLNAAKWFLLFATKRHWRDSSDIKAIQEGLQWIYDNYKAEGVRSLAVPALGCGLGKLDWQKVGPIMCRELSRLEISTVIYLPREREIPVQYLARDFLLGSSN